MSVRGLTTQQVLAVFAALAAVITFDVGRAASSSAPGQSAPVNTSAPAITGTAAQGQVLTASSGSWRGPVSGYAYQWSRCATTGSCADVAGATTQSYSLTAADVASTIVVTVTASNKNGATAARSAPTAPVAGATSPLPPPPPSPTSYVPQFYVSTSGSDAGNGSATSPWRTIQHAVDAVSTGAVVNLEPGTYAPFTLTTPGVTVTSTGGVTVQGSASFPDVIRIAGNNDTVSNFAVTGCVPSSSPSSGFENGGSSGIRINDGTSGVTVSGMTVGNSYGTNADGLPFGCYGIFAHYANQVTIANNDIYRNGTGIFIRGGGANDVISGNQVHDNNVLIRNTVAATNDDYGAMGIAFDLVSATPGPVARGNVISGNFGPSHDYGTDGSAFEIYQSSNVSMTSNQLSNNDDILETGADAGGACANNAFTGNTATGRTAGTTLSESVGLLLRCAQNMQITGNTITNVDYWVYDIVGGGSFAGSINGLTIEHNTISQQQKVYAVETSPVGLGIVIDANTFTFSGGTFASLWTGSNATSLSAWQTATGFDRTSTVT